MPVCYSSSVAGEAFKKSREAVVELIAARKLEEQKRKQLQEEFSRWEQRALEAEAAGRHEDASQAVERCTEISEADAAAKAHILRLEKEIAAAEEQLRDTAVKESRSVNAEALLASLEKVVGPSDSKGKALEKLSQERLVDEELERLKRRLAEDEPSEDESK